jgi:hypothetical protein
VLGIAGFGFALRYDTPATDAISCSVPVARLTEEHEQGDADVAGAQSPEGLKVRPDRRKLSPSGN